MLYNKLKGDDVFSLVTFHTESKTIIESSFVRDLDRGKVYEGPCWHCINIYLVHFEQKMIVFLGKEPATLVTYKNRALLI